jgi:hypothetical protein
MWPVVSGVLNYNMKVAVLFSGEYRKFDVTRKTMLFLDNPDVDVYVCTWDKTVFSSSKIGLNILEEITEEKISQDLKRNSIIRISNHNKVSSEARYNTKMVERWVSGFKLIRDSGIKYDYVVIMRTDLFFDKSPTNLDFLKNYSGDIAVAWSHSMVTSKKLADVVFAASFKNMKFLFDELSVAAWNHSIQLDWHSWWYNFIVQRFPRISDMTELGSFLFCRYWVDHNSNYRDVFNIHHDWRDLRLLHECDIYGDQHAANCWPDSVLIEARQKWNSGYFDKYKIDDTNKSNNL